MSAGQDSEAKRLLKLRGLLRRLCRSCLRNNCLGGRSVDTRQPVSYELRMRHDRHMQTRRLVVYLRGTMCEWNRLAGGCVYCGFYRATNGGKRIAGSDFLAQIADAQRAYLESEADAVGLYNDGSFFNDREIDDTTQMEMLRRVAQWPGIRQITVESRMDYVSASKLRKAQAAVGSIILEVATGIDSTNQEILDMTSNRGISIRRTLEKLAMAKEFGFRTTGLMVFGLPFLTDAEIVADACTTVEELLSRGICVDVEAMTVQTGSFLHDLYECDMYRVPWLWSIVELFRRLPDVSDVYLSPFSYSVEPVAMPHNCAECSENVKRQLHDVFMRTRCKDDLPVLEVCCGSQWQQRFRACPTTTILHRAENALKQLASRGAPVGDKCSRPLEEQC